jgi:AcrR family transcriptional regulator
LARRSDHSRLELHKMILAAAREIAETEGFRGLTVRRITDKIGYAPGTLYNVFTNLDDLIFQLRGETLDELYDYLSSELIEGKPEAILINIANNYIAYVRDHPRLWNIMFEHNPQDGLEAPEWYHEKTIRLLSLAEEAFASFFSTEKENVRFHHAQVLWAALHGICSVQIAGKLIKKESAEALAESLISKYVEGLRFEFSKPS